MAKNHSNGTTFGFEEKLWRSAEKLRSDLDASEYRTVVLGLIFLKYISDRSSENRGNLQKTLLIPQAARWDYIKKLVKQKKLEIGKNIDFAMETIEQKNPSLKGILPKIYSKDSLDRERLSELIELIESIGLVEEEVKNVDILGRVFEYFLGQFALSEGRKGGQFYTPPSIVRLLVEMIKPYKGKVFDPCCGSGGMFIQSEKFIESQGGKTADILIYGQESNRTTWALCKMNLAIHGINGNIMWGDSFSNDLHKNQKFDFVLANPPFNVKDWKGDTLTQDYRWIYGIPPFRNANFAWVQHFIHHLDEKGIAGFILTNGSLSSTMSNEGNIRKNIVEAGLVDCIVTLPDKLFYNTGIPACLWIIKRNTKNRDGKHEVLFIDARRLGVLVDRMHKQLSENDIQVISKTYINWKTETGEYLDILGFCKSSTIDQIRNHNYILTPARYVGVAETEDKNGSFKAKMDWLTSEIAEQFKESEKFKEKIQENLSDLGFEL
ncbi:MAG: N-6 DNA methylase [Promethearchaeota archaeon]